jgi:WD40 repeat protein
MYRLLDERLVYLAPVLVGLACPAPRADGGQASPPVGVRFERGPFEGRGLTTCPGGRVELKVGGKSASLYDTKTGKEIGAPLTFPGQFIETDLPEIACWAFSPDGKLVAIGSRYDEGRKVDNTRVGHIRVWDTATGALVADKPGQTGPIRRLAFTKDGRGVLFEADPYEIDGP